MNSKLKKAKALIKKFKYIVELEKDIDIYLKYPKETDLKRFRNKSISIVALKRLKKEISYIKDVLYEESEKMYDLGQMIVELFCIEGKSVPGISMECFVGRTSVYREIEKISAFIYLVLMKNRNFEKSVNYVINQLQNYL